MAERQFMKVLGREIEFTNEQLDISELRFYMENPRINYILTTHQGPVTQDLIQAKLLALDSTKDLVRDVLENKGLIEEVLVCGNEVVEGNTRLAAYRRLHARYPADPTWARIPAKVLHGEVKPEELFFILGTFHIRGKTEWGAYEKAAYIDRMVNELHESPSVVASQLGHKGGTVEAILKAYNAMSTVFLPSLPQTADDFETQDALRKYAYFEALYRQKELAAIAETTPGFVEEFAGWVKLGVFPKAADVRELPKVLANKRATDVFLRTIDEDPEAAYNEAMLKLNEVKPEKVDPFYKEIRKFRNLIEDTAPHVQKAELEKDTPAGKSRRTELRKCLRAFRQFCKEVGLEA